MNPLLAAALIQGGLQLASSFTNEEVQPTQINPETAQFMDQLQTMMQQLQAQQATQGQQTGALQTQQARTAEQIAQLGQQAQDIQAPGPNAWFEQFLGNVPEYQAIASQAADEATRIAGRGGEEQAQRMSQQAARNAASQFAGSGAGFSGAARAAATEAAVNPLAQFQQNLAGLQANTFSQGLNQLLGQGQGLAQQSQQQGFANALAQLGQNIGARQAALGGYGQAAQTSLGQQNILGNMMSNVLGQQGQIAAPVYSTPDYYNPLDRPIGAAGFLTQSLSNPDVYGGGN